MRFDDRLNTVLAQPATNPRDRAVRWRQLVELLARATDMTSPAAAHALAEIRNTAQAIDSQVRAAAARAIARRQLPPPLVAAFAEDTVAVSAPVLAAVSLTPHEWHLVVDAASVDSLRFIRSLYPDLADWRPQGPARTSIPEDAHFEPIVEPEQQPGPQSEPESEAEPEAVLDLEEELIPDPAPAQVVPPTPEPVQPRTRAPETTIGPQPQPSSPGATTPIPSISEVLARIEHLRQERQFAQRTSRRSAPSAPPRATDTAAPLFRWECGPSGEIAWVEGVPRGPLVGRSLANPGEHNGVDKRIQRAFAVRAPFRDAVLTVSGEGPVAGDWRLSGVPAFEPSDGRFAGYRGIGLRADETAGETQTALREPLDDHALRELVHELKTPLNAIVGFAEIIDGQFLGPADQTYRERASEIVAQARLLLSAIEDLDITAQLRSSPASTEGATDLNELLQALAGEFRDRAGRVGARFDLVTSRTPAISTLSRPVLERLVRRFTSALVDLAEPRERLAMVVECDVGQCLIGMGRPHALRGVSEAQLFTRDGEQDALASAFSLRLTRGIAQAAGGDLRASGDKLALVLPRRSG